MTAGPAAPSPGGRSRTWPVIHTVIRAILGAALVVFLVLIGVRLAGQQQTVTAPTASATVESTPSSTPTPTTSPAPTATPTPTAPAGGTGGTGGSGGTGGGTGGGGTAAPVITSFTGPSSVNCPTPAEAPVPGVGSAEPPTVSFAWTSTGAEEAWFGIGTKDAKAEPYSSVGVNDSIAFSYQCSNPSELYTVTVEGPGGDASKTIEVTNVGYVG